MAKENVLITGAGGQLGVELALELVKTYGSEAVIATDINLLAQKSLDFCRFKELDVLDLGKLEELIVKNNITQVYHLAAILSANGEAHPMRTWNINMQSLFNVLEMAKKYGYKIFWPSSIAVFGLGSPQFATPQNPPMVPETIYGISKQSGENWCNYYASKYGVDVRSVRYPGLIGYKTLPGGGTTDYAVDIFHKALQEEHLECYLTEETELPMMYMPDAVKAAISIMDVPKDKLRIRTAYNISGMSFTPDEIYQEIKKSYPDFTISYEPDHRQDIANSWPRTIDDTRAKMDWDWKPSFNLEAMVLDMLAHLPKTVVH